MKKHHNPAPAECSKILFSYSFRCTSIRKGLSIYRNIHLKGFGRFLFKLKKYIFINSFNSWSIYIDIQFRLYLVVAYCRYVSFFTTIVAFSIFKTTLVAMFCFTTALTLPSDLTHFMASPHQLTK